MSDFTGLRWLDWHSLPGASRGVRNIPGAHLPPPFAEGHAMEGVDIGHPREAELFKKGPAHSP